MDACVVLGVASLAIALLLGSAAFAQTPPAPTHKSISFKGCSMRAQSPFGCFGLGTTIPMVTVAGCLLVAGKRPKKVAMRFHPAKNISATGRLCHPMRSKPPARLVRTRSMSNINNESKPSPPAQPKTCLVAPNGSNLRLWGTRALYYCQRYNRTALGACE